MKNKYKRKYPKITLDGYVGCALFITMMTVTFALGT